tara:strand:+ start:13206 stop:14213 length:1008 start_codon:yes stop_codon:yes gene_type:complete
MTEGKLRELLSDLDIEVKHKNTKGWLISKCPFSEELHEYGTDSNPSFNVKIHPEGYSAFKCFTCKQKGNLLKLIGRLQSIRGEDYNNLTIRVMGEEVPDSFADYEDGIEEESELTVLEAETFLSMYPLAYEEKDCKKYLKDVRGISEATSKTLDLRYDADSRRVLFPVKGFDGSLFGFTGRTILTKEQYPSKKYPKVKDYVGLKKERLVLGEELIEEDKPILIVEGLFAYAHMVDIGVREFCSPIATMGSNLSDYQRDIIVDYDVPVFLLYDDDLAGDHGLYGDEQNQESLGAIDKLKSHTPTSVCLYPEDIDDPDDLDCDTVREMVLGSNSELQ